jgi:hypothetical protein
MSTIRNLAANSDTKVTLLKLGAGPKLLKLLDEDTPGANELDAGAIQNLAANDGNKMTLMYLGAGPKLLELLDEAWCVGTRWICDQELGGQ